VVASAIVLLAFLLVREPSGQERHSSRPLFDIGVLKEVVTHRPRELTAGGSAQVFGQMVRAGRQIIIPLYGAYVVGLDTAQVGQVVSISSAVDILLFIPAGIIMDRW